MAKISAYTEDTDPNAASELVTAYAGNNYRLKIRNINPLLPRYVEAFAEAIICSTAVSRSVVATQRYNTYSFQTAPADSQTFKLGIVLKAGTYTVTLLGVTDNASGKLDWDLDGVSQTTGQDWYASPTVLNTEKTFTLTVSTGGYHILTGTINGKNALSSNYFWTHTKITIKPAAY